MRLKIFVILSVLVSLMAGSSCEFFLDEDAEKKCEEHKWEAWDTKIHIMYGLRSGNVGPTTGHNLLDAVELRFIGTISNIDCLGGEDGYFDIDHTVYPAFLFPTIQDGVTYNVDLSPYDFPFEITNFDEYFFVTFSMDATFPDGLVLRSSQVTAKTANAQWLWTSSFKYIFWIDPADAYWTVVTK
jgi:hypothetical protein